MVLLVCSTIMASVTLSEHRVLWQLWSELYTADHQKLQQAILKCILALCTCFTVFECISLASLVCKNCMWKFNRLRCLHVAQI